MQVKKFEARSMKEALEMVKTQLGPDAIILSAKETTRNFGLGGEKSIEITAAYSNTVLHNKNYIESRMRPQDKEAFQKTSAKSQKEVLQKAIEAQVSKLNAQIAKNNPQVAAAIPRSTHKATERRYIDIDNDQLPIPPPSRVQVQTTLSTTTATMSPSTAISQGMTPAISPLSSQGQQGAQGPQPTHKTWGDIEVNSLKREIESLKQVMNQFKVMPQTFVQAHPGADLGVHYVLSSQFQRLQQRGLSSEVSAEILLQAQKQMSPEQLQNKHHVESWMAKYILDTISIATEGFEQFQLFVGPSGSGKTSSLIKMASDLILNHRKRVAIITTDTTKVGAIEQMKIFAQILNVPFLSLKSQQDWAHVIPHLDQIDHVLIDYAGLNLRSQEELNYLKRMSPPIYRSLRTHLVLSAMAKDSDLVECAQRYESFGYNDVIFTSLDEAGLHGNIYNFIRKVKTSLFAFGIGQKIPEDFERATAERVVDLILQITQSQKMQDSNI